jgi:hypothetical protein
MRFPVKWVEKKLHAGRQTSAANQNRLGFSGFSFKRRIAQQRSVWEGCRKMALRQYR